MHNEKPKNPCHFRAFYGWLAHCRHLKTVRQHLSGLTFHEPTTQTNLEWSNGLTEEYWKGYLDFIETQSLNSKNNQRLGKGSSCRNRPLKIVVSDKAKDDNKEEDSKLDGDRNDCSTNDERKQAMVDDEGSCIFDESEVYRRIYNGGIESCIRPQVNL